MARYETSWPPRLANDNPKWGGRLAEELEDSRAEVCHDVELCIRRAQLHQRFHRSSDVDV
jgi:hypothetical protein